MDGFKTYRQKDILAYVKIREGETKIGQQVAILGENEELESSAAHFVLLGIPEDIGIAANYGIRGSATAWQATLKAFLNTQSNVFFNSAEVLVLGHFEFNLSVDANRAQQLQKVSWIDEQVYPLIQRIVTAGKVPIVIGGGHNNAYPIIKGGALALGQKLNVINIDAHADLRPTDGRHSGNGFSYAFLHNYLQCYRIFGLQQNYLNTAMFEFIQDNPDIQVRYLEELLASGDPGESFRTFTTDLEHPVGLEIDLDAISGVLSSAATPSGITLNALRGMLLALRQKLSYLHICEGAVSLEDGRTDPQTGKTISFLITDFIKAQRAIG